MSRVAIIGSCITRDIWRECGLPLDDLLFISRASLPSLVSPPLPRPPALPADPPPIDGIGRHSIRQVEADLRKTALTALADHRPTHIVFDFIDERFDLLDQDGAIATHSWELEVLGLVGGPGLASPRIVDRLSPEADTLWRDGLARVADWLATPAFAQTTVILHHAQWATALVAADGTAAAFDDAVPMWPGVASITAQNALLRRYRDLFLAAAPSAHVVEAADGLTVADARHVWGLSPFHYVPAYYADVWRQLRALGV